MPANYVRWTKGPAFTGKYGTCPDCNQSSWADRWESAEPSHNLDEHMHHELGGPEGAADYLNAKLHRRNTP